MTILELELYLTHAPRTLAWTARTVSASPPGTSLGGPSPSPGSPVRLPAGIGREWLPVGPDWNKKPTMNVYIKCCHHFSRYYLQGWRSNYSPIGMLPIKRQTCMAVFYTHIFRLLMLSFFYFKLFSNKTPDYLEYLIVSTICGLFWSHSISKVHHVYVIDCIPMN